MDTDNNYYCNLYGKKVFHELAADAFVYFSPNNTAKKATGYHQHKFVPGKRRWCGEKHGQTNAGELAEQNNEQAAQRRGLSIQTEKEE